MRFLGLGLAGWVWITLQVSYLVFFVKLHLGQRDILRRLDGRLIDRRP